MSEQTVEKKAVSILNEKGQYVAPSLVEINRQAHASIVGRKVREKNAMKDVAAAVKRAIRRS